MDGAHRALVCERGHFNLHQPTIEKLATVVLVELDELLPTHRVEALRFHGSHVAHSVTALFLAGHVTHRTTESVEANCSCVCAGAADRRDFGRVCAGGAVTPAAAIGVGKERAPGFCSPCGPSRTKPWGDARRAQGYARLTSLLATT